MENRDEGKRSQGLASKAKTTAICEQSQKVCCLTYIYSLYSLYAN